MINKSRIFGLLAILVVAFLIFGPEDEPKDSEDRGGDSKSATERRLEPREPAFLAPGRDYGIAGRQDRGNTAPSYPRPQSFPQQTFPRENFGGYDIPDSYGEYPRAATGGYRFRPLSEQEQQRTRSTYQDQYADQYARPYGPPPQYDLTSETPPRYDETGPYYDSPGSRAPYQEYSYRPLEKSPGARGRWQGPYQDPSWDPSRRFDPYETDPWMAPPPPQWGSMPPSQRMYPSLYLGPGYRLSER